MGEIEYPGVYVEEVSLGVTPIVHCGNDTVTQDDIDNGRLNIVIGIAPLKPAEFVIFRIAQCTRLPWRHTLSG